jgi:hypothetical protein
VKDATGHVDHALELSGKDLNPVILYIDPATSLPRKQVYTSEAPGRPLVEEQFSDYRAVDGIQIPFTASRKLGPQTVERHAAEVKINAPIDPAQFKRPAS